uniref:Uncharacterized protein n=1 Tax=Aegilops tauschii TaxID=37682 RepID=M8BEE7_AEGTA
MGFEGGHQPRFFPCNCKKNMVMDSTDRFDKSPLLDGGSSSQENSTEYTGDGSVCTSGHPASRKHTGNWKASSLTIGQLTTAQRLCIISLSIIRTVDM